MSSIADEKYIQIDGIMFKRVPSAQDKIQRLRDANNKCHYGRYADPERLEQRRKRDREYKRRIKLEKRQKEDDDAKYVESQITV